MDNYDTWKNTICPDNMNPVDFYNEWIKHGYKHRYEQGYSDDTYVQIYTIRQNLKGA